jgi:hypothetical protein
MPSKFRKSRVECSDSPPSYSVVDLARQEHRMQATDSPYAFLANFDTIFLIDDSSSMAGRNWAETSNALRSITPICTAHDIDGIDIYFLNHRNPNAKSTCGAYTNLTTPADVENIFRAVRPWGITPTGGRLNDILKPYLKQLKQSINKQAWMKQVWKKQAVVPVKPLNIIVITDGVPSDDVEGVIVNTAKKLDKYEADPWQVGIQFFQVGRDLEATGNLTDLDDTLSKQHDIRDMVDTVPWSEEDGRELTAEGILKVVLGSVNKKLDRQPGSGARLRR